MVSMSTDERKYLSRSFPTVYYNTADNDIKGMKKSSSDLTVHSSEARIRSYSDSSPLVAKHEVSARPLCLDHKWFVLITAFICVGLDIGFIFSLGALLPEILDEFGDSRASSAVIQSVMIGVTLGTGACCVYNITQPVMDRVRVGTDECLEASSTSIQRVMIRVMLGTGVINGSIIIRIGPHRGGMVGGLLVFVGTAASYFATSTVFLIISLGIVAGFGSSFVYITTAAAAGHYFETSGKYLALSFVSSAAGVGTVCYPYLYSWITPRFGIQGLFLIISGLFLNIVPAAVLWKPKQARTGNGKENDRKLTQTEQNSFLLKTCRVLRNKLFVFFAIAACFGLPSFNTFVGLAFDMFHFKGMDDSETLLLFLVFNILATVGRLTPGLLKLVPHIGSLVIPVIVLSFGLPGFIGLILSNTYILLMLSSVCIGLGYGGIVGCMTVVPAQVTEAEEFTTSISIVFTVLGVANVIAAPIGGLVYDKTQSYDIVFYTCTGGVLCAITFALIAVILKKIQDKAKISYQNL